MVGAARDWIVRQLSLGEFDSHSHVWRKSVVMAFKITALAYGLNLISHFVLYGLGLLPYALGPALIIATVLTPPISFFVALVAYSVIGFAIHELGITRAELERLSHTDMLSGLPNRRAFQTAFEACETDKAMVVFDIDRFKSVNDGHGHSVGDEVIVKVAGLLPTVFGEDCLCARIGGEEFAVFSGVLAFAEFAALAEVARIRTAALPIGCAGGAVSVTLSGGVARALPGDSFGDTFSRADKALYAAKKGGRNRIVLSYGEGRNADLTDISAA